jgi:hypothetical protein
MIAPEQRFEGSHANVMLGMGIGLPEASVRGHLIVGYEPASWLALEGHGTVGDPFGPGLGAGARLMAPPLLGMRFGLGAGYAANYLQRDPSNPEKAYPGAPGTAHFLQLELSSEQGVGAHFSFRFGVRLGYLLNAGDYQAMCPPMGCSAFGPVSAWESNGGPWAVANGSRIDEALDFGVGWAFEL